MPRMFLRWLFTRFPAEMRHGWRLVRRDVVVWMVIATIMVGSALVSAPAVAPLSPSVGLVLAMGAGLFVIVILAKLFDAAAAARPCKWQDLLSTFARRGAPTLYFVVLAVTISRAAESLVKVGAHMVLDQTPIRPYATAVLGVVVLVTLLTRFCFVPFLAVLESRKSVEPAAKSGPAWNLLAVVAWPLLASSRMSERIRWSLAPYIVLSIAAPLPAVFVPPALRLPLVIALQMVSFTAMAVIFDYYTSALATLRNEAPSTTRGNPR